MLSFLLAAITVAPWTGHDLPTATQAAAKYRVAITGNPGSTVHLTTSGLAKGWVAAFCNMTVCSPGQVRETIPRGGRAVIQFELIREADDAPKHTGVMIHASDGSRVVIP
ncbi:MAG TPA: hypothetical protein VIK27_01755 [Candidatus Aquilonibacter sp.]